MVNNGNNNIINISDWWFGTMEFYDFPDIGNVIIPTDFHSVQRGRYTTNQYMIHLFYRYVVVYD